MAKYTKPNYSEQWASAAGGGSVAPNSTKIQTGHIVEKPNYTLAQTKLAGLANT
jgi:hypothetical protein